MMSRVEKLSLICAILLTAIRVTAAQTSPAPAFAAGADISELATLQSHGAVYREHGTPLDPYRIFASSGVNWMRIRLFVHPDGVGPLINDLPYTISMARKIKSNGFKLLLDIHYSDGWADPHQQNKPEQWRGVDHSALTERVQSYTYSAVQALAATGAAPDMVEVGNEITNGMLWEDGRVSPQSKDDSQWSRLSDLLKAGIAGVHDATPQSQIMIHIDRGGDVEASRTFYQHILDNGVQFDCIGLSDYPWWQGSLSQLAANLTSLANTFHKPIIVVETAFPFKPQTINAVDNLGNIVGHDSSPEETERDVLHYPASPTGQAAFLKALIAVVKATPDGLGAGVFYWAAAWIPNRAWGPPPWSSDWEGRALFDQRGNALPALRVLGDSAHDPAASSLVQRNQAIQRVPNE